MSDTVCVVTADCPEKRGYVLRGGHGKIEAILGVEKRAGFAVDGLVRAKEPRCKLLSFGMRLSKMDGRLRCRIR